MSERASTEEVVISDSLQKEAVDALAQLKEAEQKETFDYFQALMEFQKHASNSK